MQTNSSLNPELQRLLRLCNMNRKWVKGEGAWLYDSEGRRFLDCYGQYGAVSLGHNFPKIVAAVKKELDANTPAMVQPYRAPHATALANALVRVAPKGLARCVFTSSGAETVEAAIKLVRSRTGKSTILSCEGSYHGKTMGAMAVSGEHVHKDFFGPGAPAFSHIPFGDADRLEDYLSKNADQVAAFFLEPIQGERGVIIPPHGYLKMVREICTRHGVPLVLDEIQTGLGRTGRMFGCDHEDVSPDIMLLSKSLGGGLFPLGACLATEEVWDPRFALCHSSTFANNNLTCRVGLAVIEELVEGGWCERAEVQGERLIAGLKLLAARYPNTIAEVRGRGLMAAVQLKPIAKDNTGLVQSYLYHQGLYAYSIAAAIAEMESVLVLPVLGDANILRIAPPLIIGDDQLETALEAFDRVFSLVEQNATHILIRAMGRLDQEPQQPVSNRGREPIYLPPSNAEPVEGPSYAFIIHYTSSADVRTCDPSLANLNQVELDRYCSFIADIPPGVVYEAPRLYSRTGESTKGWLIALGMLPEEMYRRGRSWVGSEIRRAVDLASQLGARVVGLGAFTTVFSRRGADVVGRGPTITTGNSLTAAMAFAAILRVAERRGLSLHEARVGVVGANGSVGSLCAKLLARAQPRSMVLVGNPRSGVRHLESNHLALEKLHSCPVELTTDIRELRSCDIILSATSSRRAILDDAPLKPGVIICDAARPADASEELRTRRDITVIDGGLVALPDPQIRFGLGNIQGFPNGIQLACFAETMLLSLAQETKDRGIGDGVSLEEVDYVTRLADIHGFSLAEPPRDALDKVKRESPRLAQSYSEAKL